MKDCSNPRPHILVLTSTFPRWESDTEPAFVFELSRRLAMTFNVTILAPRSPGSKSQETMAGLRVIRYPYFFRKWENLATHNGGILNRLKSNPFNYLLVPFFLAGQLFAFIRLLRRDRFSLIHAHWLIPQGVIAVLGQILTRRRIPLLCTSHGGDLFDLQGEFFLCLKRWVIDKSQGLTVVSQVMREIIINMGIPSERVRVIPMGVDLENHFTCDSTIDRRSDEILFVGRLVEKKGLRILIEALPAVLRKHPSVHLTVAGAGPLSAELHELTEQLRLSHHVDFLGMVPQSRLPDLYRRATVAVFPFVVAKSGDQEGFGLVQVEAMGCGCPVIAGDLPAIHDNINHMKNGLLVNSRDQEALSNAISEIFSDADLGLKLAAQANKDALERFDWMKIVEKYALFYGRLINNNQICKN